MEVETESPVIPNEEEIRQRILREREAAEAERLARDKEIEEESARLDKLIEQEIRGVSSDSARARCHAQVEQRHRDDGGREDWCFRRTRVPRLRRTLHQDHSAGSE